VFIEWNEIPSINFAVDSFQEMRTATAWRKVVLHFSIPGFFFHARHQSASSLRSCSDSCSMATLIASTVISLR